MRPMVTDVAGMICVCVGHMGDLCKTAEPIEKPFGGLNHVDQETVY